MIYNIRDVILAIQPVIYFFMKDQDVNNT